MRIRILFGVVLVLSVAWSVYWFVGSSAMERGANQWFADQAAAGLVAEHGDLSVAGYPSRFDLTVNDLYLADPLTGYAWTAPFVQILTLSYKPWHLIAALPNDQSFQTPLQKLTLASAKLQASLVVQPSNKLALDRTRIVGDSLTLSSDLGWSIGAKTLRFATDSLTPDALQHEVGLELLQITPDAALSALLPELPTEIERARLDAKLTLTAPPDQQANETRPQVQTIEVKDLALVWGPIQLSGKGTVTADAMGQAEGRVDLRLTNWRKALPLAVATGLMRPEVQQTWENMLAALASESGNPDDLDMPLSFQRGRMMLGPLPLGSAPVLIAQRQ
ncbi:MAG: High-affinity K+ transporter ATPase chain B [Cereibacter sphaeroides]|uniref:High-affinity K+ transporter ATPase chain B n=1 Tax=Cereibacter sphaeroides TaxID=1063 RepID=A0A2W5SCK3_CERSP|nr:MAG: High-affinity K+ transporter ATPase chain B [Cereibacter sphaeroides]